MPDDDDTVDQCQEHASQRRPTACTSEDRPTAVDAQQRRTAFTPEGKRA